MINTELTVIRPTSGSVIQSEFNLRYDYSLAATKRLISYIGLMIRHGTLRKYVNLARVEWEHWLGREHLKGKPYLLKIDPTNICNLRCSDCYTGRLLNQRPRGMMSFETFKIIVDQNKEHVFKINLYVWGESFLVKDIYKMIRYAADNNIAVVISSNMSLTERCFQPEEIVRSGLDLLIMSIDGIDQATNVGTRAGSDFNVIMANVRAIVAARHRLKSAFPVLEWQFLVHEGNRHQIPEARRMAKELGVDVLRFSPHYKLMDQYALKKKSSEWTQEDMDQRHFMDSHCVWPYRAATFNWNGDVAPCCNFVATDDVPLSYGNIQRQPFGEIWNNETYLETRYFLRTGRRRDKKILTPCLNCTLCNKDE